MPHILLKRSILYTIVHFTLCYAIATGCWDACKKSVDKSTTIKIVAPPVATLPNKTAADDLSSIDAQDEEEEEDEDEDKGENEDEEEEEEQKKIEEIIQSAESMLSKDSVEGDLHSNSLPSAPPADLEDTPYTQEPPFPYKEESPNNFSNGSFYSDTIPTSSTQFENTNQDDTLKSNPLKHFLENLGSKYKPKCKKTIDKIKLNIRCFIKPKDKLIQEQEALEKNREAYKKLQEVRERNKSNPALLDETDKELLEQYKHKNDEQVDSKIQALRFRIVFLKEVIQKKKQEKDKKLTKLTAELKKLENKRGTYRRLRSARDYEKCFSEGLTEEQIKLLNQYKSISDQQIDPIINDLNDKIGSLETTIQKKQKAKQDVSV